LRYNCSLSLSSLGKLLGADILQGTDLLLSHGRLDSHHKILATVESFPDLINKAFDLSKLILDNLRTR
jgi:hypothetical protein